LETQTLRHISAESVTFSPDGFQAEHSLFRFEIGTVDSTLIFLLFRYSEICILHFQSN